MFPYPTYDQTSSILKRLHPGVNAKTIYWSFENGTIQIEKESEVENNQKQKKVGFSLLALVIGVAWSEHMVLVIVARL